MTTVSYDESVRALYVADPVFAESLSGNSSAVDLSELLRSSIG